MTVKPMPHSPFRSPYPARSTPVPNALLDRLPDLGSAELRVLLVVARQTLGWIDPRTGRRKEADWLTQNQMLARTGCSRAPLSRAIDTLVRTGWIAVTGSAGETLDTPEARRRHRGQLWYRLLMPDDGAGLGTPQSSEPELHRPGRERTELNTTKETGDRKEARDSGPHYERGRLSGRRSLGNQSKRQGAYMDGVEARERLLAKHEQDSAGRAWHWSEADKRWVRHADQDAPNSSGCESGGVSGRNATETVADTYSRWA